MDPLLLSPSPPLKAPQPNLLPLTAQASFFPHQRMFLTFSAPLQVLLEKLTSDKLLLMLQGPLQMPLFGGIPPDWGLLQDHPVQSHIHPGILSTMIHSLILL